MASDYVSILGQSTTLDTGSGSGSKPRHEPIKATSGALHTNKVSLDSGENQTFDRTFGGPMSNYEVCTQAQGDQQVGTAGPSIYYGYIVNTQVTTAAFLIRDGTSDAGTAIDQVPTASTAGTKSISPVGIYCPTGIWVDINGAGAGSITVLYISAV